MQYILTEEEYDDLIPLQVHRGATARAEVAIQAFRNSQACAKHQGSDYCDDCPIGSLDNGLGLIICHDEYYSK